jgi:hypothetical protein
MSVAMRCPRDRGDLNWLGPGDFLLGDDADPVAAAAGYGFPRWQDYLFAVWQLNEPPDDWSITLDDILGALGETPRQPGRFTHLVSSASSGQCIGSLPAILFVRIVA